MATERRLEIFGILLIAISVFLFFSLIGYNPSEEPTISPNIRPANPMGILGIFLSHFLIKMGFGYSTICVPILGLIWGWFLFSKKETNKLKLATYYSLAGMMLLSTTLGVITITFSNSDLNYVVSGLVGANIAQFLKDWLSTPGTILFLFSAFLILARGYFDLDFHKPLKKLKEKFKTWYKQFLEKKIQRQKSNEKRKHTEELKKKIDAKSEFKINGNQNHTGPLPPEQSV